MVNAYGEKLVAINLDRMAHYIGRGIKISNDVEQLLGEYEFEIMIVSHLIINQNSLHNICYLVTNVILN